MFEKLLPFQETWLQEETLQRLPAELGTQEHSKVRFPYNLISLCSSRRSIWRLPTDSCDGSENMI